MAKIYGDANGIETNDNLNGGAGDDEIYGYKGDDSLNGYEGEDKIFGGEGNDYILGGHGDDILKGGAGNDSIRGGLSTFEPTSPANKGKDKLYGEDGNDYLIGNDGDDYFEGGDGQDRIIGVGGNDTIFGGKARDDIFAGEGDDYIDAGEGDDFIDGGDGDDRIIGGSGADTIQSGVGDNLINGGTGDDIIRGSYGNNVIYGDEGDDEIRADTRGTATSIIHGGSGKDTIYTQNGKNQVFGDSGDDIINVSIGGEYEIDGGIGYDTLITIGHRNSYKIGAVGNEIFLVKLGNQETSIGNITAKSIETIIFSDGEWDGVLDDDCPHDTGNYIIGGIWNHDEIKKICETVGTVLISQKVGTAGLEVRGTGASKHDDKTLNTSEGVIFANIDGQKTQLFTGKVDLTFAGSVFNISDEKNNDGDLQLAGMDLQFSNLNILADSVRGNVAFNLPEELTGKDNLVTIDGLGTVAIVDKDGVHLGLDVKISIPDKEFSFFSYFNVKGSGQSISYIAVEDAIQLQGKYEVESFIKDIGVDKIVLDLSDKNFVKITNGKADFKGSITASKDVAWNPDSWGLSQLKLDFDTIAHKVGGTIGIKFPFNGDMAEIIGTMEFITEPKFELDAIGLKVDDLGIPVGNSGVFLKSINGKILHMAPSSKVGMGFSGGIELTAGPVINGVSLATIGLQGTLDGTQIIGEGKLTIIDDKILNATGKSTVDWHKGHTTFNGDMSILDGFFTTKNEIKANTNFDFSFDGNAKVNVPNFVAGIGGTNLDNAFYRVSFTNDDNLTNDFAAAWTEQTYSKFGVTVKFAMGAKYTFDEKWSLFGLNNIPQLQAPTKSAAQAKVEATQLPEWQLLLANWENASSNVTLRVIDPNGKTIEQADFAANKIEILTDLSSDYAKTLLVVNPIAGNYKLEIVDTTGLGDTKFSAATENQKPTLTLAASLEDSANGTQVTINYEAYDGDSAAKLSLFYDTDNQDNDGVMLKSGIVEADDAGSYTWNVDASIQGEHYIYGILSDGINADTIVYSSQKIDLTSSLDLFEPLGNSTLNGAGGNDKLISLSGNNTLDGAGNNDLIIGGIDADKLIGGTGNDVIRGDASDIMGGSDILEGNAGDDLLMGGLGADLFKFSTNDGKDTIAQFKTENLSFDATTGYSATATAADFQLGIDHIELNGFATTTSTNVMDAVSQGDDGAIFNAEGTEITLFGVDANQVSANDFLFI